MFSLPAVESLLQAFSPNNEKNPVFRVVDQLEFPLNRQHRIGEDNGFPKVSLSSLLGFQTGKDFGNIDTWSVAGIVKMPFLDFGRVKGMVEQADARQEAAYATYEQTVKAALAEVETSYVGLIKAQQRLEKLKRAAKASRTAEEISRVHFQEGMNSLLDVLYAQQNRLEAETSLATQQALVGQRFAALYKAIGGGAKTSSTLVIKKK